MAPRRLALGPLATTAVIATAIAVGLVPACAEDGTTATCPELLVYDIRDDAQRTDPAVVENRELASDAGCVTLPGDAISTGGAAGTPGGD